MIDIRSELGGLTDRGRWAARGASFVTKHKATKAVWFPPAPVRSATKATTGTAGKATGATTKAKSGTKKAKSGTTNATSAAKKLT